MKIFKSLLVAGLITVAGTSVNASETTAIVYNETPAKTVVIKHPAASDVNAFFAGATMLTFEVYKAGSKEDVANIIKTLKADKNIESVSEGHLTGDYQAITITLKAKKDKAYFAGLFQKAGLGHVKINNNPIITTDKM